MIKGKTWLFVLVAVLTLLVAGAVACGPAAAPTPTPTKAPAAAPTQAPAAAPTTAPTKAPEPIKPPAATPTTPPKALDPIKLGYLGSFSGPMAAMGAPARDSVLMLEEKVNKEGGINGRPLKVIVYDDESDETKGVLAMKKVVSEDQVLGIIGTNATGVAMAQTPIVEEAKVPWITMASSSGILLPPKKWVFKVSCGEPCMLSIIYSFLKSKGTTSIAWISPGNAFGRGTVRFLDETAAKEGITVLAKEEYGPSDTDMKPQLTKLKATNPKALVVYGAEPAGAIAARQAKELGINVPILTTVAMTTPPIMNNKELRDGLEGAYVGGLKIDIWQQLPDTDRQKPVLKALDEQLKAKFGPTRTLSNFEGVGYDAFMVMIDAMKRANPDPAKMEEARGKIRDAIEQTKDFIGAETPLSASPEKHDLLDYKAMVVTQITEGKFKLQSMQ